MPIKANDKKNDSLQLLSVLLATTHRFFFIVSIIVFVIVLAVGYLFLIQPKYSAMAEKTKTKEDQENQQLQDLQTYLSKLIQYREQYNKIDPVAKEKIGAMIAGKFSPEDVFTIMEKLIASRGLILNSISVNTASNNGEDSSGSATAGNISGVGKATIKLDIAGVNYEGLKQLLAVIENSIQLSDVQKIEFSPEKNTTTLEIATYYLN
jgi:capsular polysaccharide biosynthesis protein